MSFRSNEEFLFFETIDPTFDFQVAAMYGSEGISSLFSFNLEVVSSSSHIDYDDMLGQACVISIDRINHQNFLGVFSDAQTNTRYIHGVVSDFVLDEEGPDMTTYHMTVVPKAFPSTYRTNRRIFQKLKVDEIIAILFKELGMEVDDFRWDCLQSYEPIEYCVQYDESEFDFISRLLEREGIFYYFEHSAENHVMVFSDDVFKCISVEPATPVPFASDSQGFVTNEFVRRFTSRKQIRNGKVAFRDYNFQRPSLKLDSVQNASEFVEHEDYKYGRFDDKTRGDKLAQIRLESHNAEKVLGMGASNVNKLCPGYTFELDDQQQMRYSGDYLITFVAHEAQQPGVRKQGASVGGSTYANDFQCVPSNVAYRAAQKTNWPVVNGTQTAVVTGPADEEIYTDEHGRIKVKFHWDRYNAADENSSCWVRVSQLWAGQGYGGFSLPRIGHEVIVDHIDGNPDLPIITGRVHHGENRSPYKLPDKKTVSTLKTNSSKGGGGFNELRFEDKKDSEEVYMHAQKDHNTVIQNDESHTIGHNRSKSVGNDQSERVAQNKSIDVGNDHKETIGNNVFYQVGKTQQEQYGKDHIHNVGNILKQNIHADHLEMVGGNYEGQVNGKLKLDVGDTITTNAGQVHQLMAGQKFEIRGPGGKITLDSSGITLEAAKINLKGQVSMGGSGSSQVPTLDLAANKALPICEECEAQKEK
ncbi:type VI secretion system Vgr family protein [Ningiella sp. W23]|uniref:type VI secretion system Vgr family protein n=1 Tax=Ningiella sp. W23 TaxID=3023715 RepID=UPI0037564706